MQRTALFFVYVWPEPRSSAAGVRTYALLQHLKSAGWKLAAVSPSGESVHRDALRALDVQTITCDPNSGDAADALLAGLNPSLVIYDRFVMEEQFGWRARELWPAALHLVDTQDLHSVRRERERLAKQGSAQEALLELDPAKMELDLLRELASLYRADAALVVSSWEEQFLLEKLGFPREALLYLPFPGERVQEPVPFVKRSGFCFLGNFRHPPNLDSVRFLVSEIWPALRERLPSATLHFYGAYPPAEVSRFQGEKGIFAHGPVQDHRAALASHRALLSPLRFGAGIKGKVLEAWGVGTPVIGSKLTFEGMGEGGLLAYTPAEWASACVALEAEATWLDCQRLGFSLLESSFSEPDLSARFLAFVEAKLTTLPQDRAANLIGRMLRLQENNSTKYFSRWIEAKNRGAPKS